jgi:hypothetical protein
MLARVRAYLTYANVISTLCLFVLLGGSAYGAFQLSDNSVRSKHIVNGQVKEQDLAPQGADLIDAGVTSGAGAGCDTGASWIDDLGGNPASFYRDLAGTVHLRGRVVKCQNNSDPILTLPPGYRPEFDESQLARSDNGAPGFVAINIDNDGSVRPAAIDPANGVAVWLDGMTFRCSPSGQDGCP